MMWGQGTMQENRADSGDKRMVQNTAGQKKRPRRLHKKILIGVLLSLCVAAGVFLLWLGGAFLPGWTDWQSRELTAVMRNRNASEMYEYAGMSGRRVSGSSTSDGSNDSDSGAFANSVSGANAVSDGVSGGNTVSGSASDGGGEKVTEQFRVCLRNRRMSVYGDTGLDSESLSDTGSNSENLVYQTRIGLKVSDVCVGDLDGDGYDEIILLLWKRGSYGTSHPYWQKNDLYRFSQHIFIYTLRDGQITPWWFSSAIGVRAADISLTAHPDGKRQMVCIKDSEGKESCWYWHGFGLAKMEESGEQETTSTVGSSAKTAESMDESSAETVHLLAVGDNLISDTIYHAAHDKASGSWDFSGLYEHIADRVRTYDLAAINEETILVHDPEKRSSFPRFGTPDVIGNDIRNAGFNIVTAATNHAWDKGREGIDDTIRFWKQYPDVTLLGIHGSAEEQDRIIYTEKNGIRFALFNYTYGLSAGTLPAGDEFRIDLLQDKDRLINDLHEAEQSADMSIVFIHMGTEYRETPTDEQKALAQELTAAGADLIIGAHPHCVEPMARVTAANGNTSVVYYSLGNLVSTQMKPNTILGGAADVTIVKKNGVTSVSEAKLQPTVCHMEAASSATTPSTTASLSSASSVAESSAGKPVVTVYFLADYTEELAERHYFRNFGQTVTLASLKKLWQEVSGQAYNDM